MFNLPNSAYVDKKISKETLYRNTDIKASTKECFVRQIENIRWMYKISKETINIEKHNDIEEIQIFHISLKEGLISDKVLQTIDRAIPYAILFYITYNNKYKLKIAYKKKNKNDENKAVIDSYYETEWKDISEEKLNVIKGGNTKSIYDNIIKSFIQIDIKLETDIKDVVDKNKEYETLKINIEKLKGKISKEKQFNKKVEMNMKLHKLIEKLDKY